MQLTSLKHLYDFGIDWHDLAEVTRLAEGDECPVRRSGQDYGKVRRIDGYLWIHDTQKERDTE